MMSMIGDSMGRDNAEFNSDYVSSTEDLIRLVGWKPDEAPKLIIYLDELIARGLKIEFAGKKLCWWDDGFPGTIGIHDPNELKDIVVK